MTTKNNDIAFRNGVNATDKYFTVKHIMRAVGTDNGKRVRRIIRAKNGKTNGGVRYEFDKRTYVALCAHVNGIVNRATDDNTDAS